LYVIFYQYNVRGGNMSDAMVTARMPQAKKDAGSRVLSEIGSNASQLINDVYDYLIEYGASPCAAARGNDAEPVSRARIQEALASIETMCLPVDNRFRMMDDEAIRRERLAAGGLMGR
jgi:antitoxin component of RelBE/YafQ-DinJ toxin-antitoxin module